MSGPAAIQENAPVPPPDPAENWTPLFWAQFAGWSNALQAAERQELAESRAGSQAT